MPGPPEIVQAPVAPAPQRVLPSPPTSEECEDEAEEGEGAGDVDADQESLRTTPVDSGCEDDVMEEN